MDDSELLQAAAEAARSQAKSRIQASFRELALQSLRQSLTVDHGQQKIVLSESSWMAVQAFCKEVAGRWSDKLRAVGHTDIADLVQDCVVTGAASLFGSGTSEQRQSSAQGSDSAAAAGSNALEPGQAAVTCHGRLRRLGHRDVLAAAPTPTLSKEAATKYLNELGRANQTDWPFSWRLIEQATEQIPARLHSRSTTTEEITLIPKSLWLKQQQASGGDASNVQEPQQSEEVNQWLIDRKRKSTQREEQLAPRVESTSDVPEDTPRPPSQAESTTFSMQAVREQMTPEERFKLDSYLHANSKDGGKERPYVLGGLRDVGHFHYWKQQQVDPVAATMSDKKRRRIQRKAVKERLGDHKDERDSSAAAKKRVSRVLRTVDESGRQWFDFDVGECWLERRDLETGRRALYAFSSLEVLALDEDEDVEDEDDAGQQAVI